MEINIIRNCIRYNIAEMQKRGMLFATKWLCEQLIGNFKLTFLVIFKS